MSKDAKAQHTPHKDPKIAYHIEWEFRREAALWVNNETAGPNLYPFATELLNWLQRKPAYVRFLSQTTEKFTNRYTYDASVLTSAFMYVINDSADFIKGAASDDSTEIEIKRIRLYTENVLYTARLCEAFIKQLLFCTSFPKKDYQGCTLGALLSKHCAQNSKEKQHKVSLLGSVAHRYRMCHEYEDCLNQHLQIVKRRRDLEAAHSGVLKPTGEPFGGVRRQFEKEFTKISQDFVHMLEYISAFESRMLYELYPITAKRSEKVNMAFTIRL